MIKLKREAMSDVYKRFTNSVFTFNWLAGNTDGDGKIEPARWQELVDLYYSLIREELDELDQALLDNDAVEVLDAVGDVLVVATFYHYLHQYGDGGVMCYAEYLNSEDAGENLYQYTAERSITDWSVVFKRAALIGDLQKLWSLVYELDVSPKFLIEITESNTSKFERMFDESAKNHAEYLATHHGQAVRFEQVGVFTRFVREDGKLLKGGWFVEPQLAEYV